MPQKPGIADVRQIGTEITTWQNKLLTTIQTCLSFTNRIIESVPDSGPLLCPTEIDKPALGIGMQ
jgi:hypothetical protein